MTPPVSKLSRLLALMQEGDWERALSLAAKFPDLGNHKRRITLGHEACAHARFYRELGRDPDALIRDGIAALKERYCNARTTTTA